MTDAQQTDVQTTATKPAPPRFVDEAARSEVLPLQHPITFDGKVWTEITVRRPNTPEVEAWARRVEAQRQAGADVTDVLLPLYDAPDEVINFLDPDDDDRLTEVSQRFLPRRFRVVPGS